MTQPPNPIAQGFRQARRDPASFLVEVLWRWSFGIVALFLTLVACAVLLRQFEVSDMFLSAWRTQNFRLMGVIGLSILIKPAAKLFPALAELMALAAVLGLVWSILSAAARRIVVRRLSSRAPLGFRTMLVVQGLRALVALLAILLVMGSLAGALYAATRGPQPDLFRFYQLSAPSVLVIIVLWLVLNWHLSMTGIFGQEGQGIGAARKLKQQAIRRHRSDFAGTAFIFLLLRCVALLVVVAIIGLTSSMQAGSPQAYFALLVTVALAYFVVSDFLYVARTGAYLALGAAPDPIAAEMGIVDPDVPVEKSS